ncbi:MAG: hypothetical protein K6F00_11090 [Lachnospiraceae bacterium]|nr:hypothetical protein [Lachnospiraceae bacterium]
MKVKDLIPVIEGQIEHLVIGTNKEGILAESESFPYCDSVAKFLHRFEGRTIDYITPMDSSYLEITIK